MLAIASFDQDQQKPNHRGRKDSIWEVEAREVGTGRKITTWKVRGSKKSSLKSTCLMILYSLTCRISV